MPVCYDRGMLLLLCAGIWGFAEATLFFVVPDVLLSAIALRNPRAALAACLISTAGAMVGGTVMYFWGAMNSDVAVATVTAVPAVGPEMMERAFAALRENGPAATILGPLTATPYKVYAVQAPAAGIPYWLFMLITPLARLPRFLLVTLFAGGVAHLLRGRVGTRTLYALWFAAWLCVYALLWSAMLV
jgi:membrane protein YqaA with SNARE-associated domain